MFSLPDKIVKTLDILEQNGEEAYLVGGCVRDMLCGKIPHDYDITTSCEPEKTASLFPKAVLTGIKHGTVTVPGSEYDMEITTYRTDGKYTDHRRPENVTFVRSLKEDLARRDFTVNAMAYHPKRGLRDFFGGKEDLANKLLRAVGEPEKRFTEDALRILRLFRFSSQLGFSIEENTLNAALSCADLLPAISAERIFSELYRTLQGTNPAALSPLIEAGKCSYFGIVKHPDYRALSALKGNSALFVFLFTGGADLQETLTALKASNLQKAFCRGLETLLKFPYPTDKPALKQMLYLTSFPLVENYLRVYETLYGNDPAAAFDLLNEIENQKEPYLLSDLAVNGKQLKKLGITGEETGNILEALRKQVILHPEENKTEHLLLLASSYHRDISS